MLTSTGQPYAFTAGDPLNATDPLGLLVASSGNGGTGCHSFGDPCGNNGISAAQGARAQAGISAYNRSDTSIISLVEHAGRAIVTHVVAPVVHHVMDPVVRAVASGVSTAANTVATAAVHAGEFVYHHPWQIATIVGGAVALVGGGVLTGALVDVLWATGAELVAEEDAVGGLEAADLAIHAPFVLAPGITMGMLGASSIGWGVSSSVSGSGGP